MVHKRYFEFLGFFVQVAWDNEGWWIIDRKGYKHHAILHVTRVSRNDLNAHVLLVGPLKIEWAGI